MEYWIEKFAAHAYRPVYIQSLFAEDGRIKKWYRENIILFASPARFEEIEKVAGGLLE